MKMIKEWDSCFRWGEKVYVYDRKANAILCLENGIWSVTVWLSKKLYGQPFSAITVYKGNLYLYGRQAKYIVQCNLIGQTMQKIELIADWADEKGFFFSNLFFGNDEIFLLPLRGNQVKVFDLYGNTLQREWQMDFEKKMQSLKKNYDVVQIRAWGAHMIEGSIFMIFTNLKEDKFAIYRTSDKKLELVPVWKYEQMLHLCYGMGAFYAQGICGSKFKVVKLDIHGNILQDSWIKGARSSLHIQWLDHGKWILVEEDRLFILDEEFRVEEIPLLLEEGTKLKYVNDNLFIDSENSVYHFNAENKKFCCFRENEGAEKNLLVCDKYQRRMLCFLKKRLENDLVGEGTWGFDIADFAEVPFVNVKKGNGSAYIGKQVWGLLD